MLHVCKCERASVIVCSACLLSKELNSKYTLKPSRHIFTPAMMGDVLTTYYETIRIAHSHETLSINDTYT